MTVRLSKASDTICVPMPRATTKNTKDTKAAPRKRVAKKATTARDSSVKKAPRKTTTKKVERKPTAAPTRRAPTKLARASTSGGERRNRKLLFLVPVIALLLTGGTSAAIGMSDNGAIDVNTMVANKEAERAERGAELAAEKTEGATASEVQDANVAAAGASNQSTDPNRQPSKLLKGIGKGPKKPPVAKPVVVASSTEAVATSTEVSSVPKEDESDKKIEEVTEGEATANEDEGTQGEQAAIEGESESDAAAQ